MATEILAIEKLLEDLFADKKAVYIDDIILHCSGIYEVWWCLSFILKQKNINWQCTNVTRTTLIDFVRTERLNYWEAFRYDDITGSVQPFTNVTTDLDTFLDENYRDVVKEYLMASKKP